MSWSRTDSGYAFNEGRIVAIVVLDGEIWRTRVYIEGVEVDRGEWDSRSSAFRNARGAIRRAIELRSPLAAANAPDEDEE